MDTYITKWIFILTVYFYHLQEARSIETENPNNGRLNGEALLEMGTKLHKPLLRLIGKSLLNVENEVRIKLENQREKIVEEICRLHPCSLWSEWTKCDATQLGAFGAQLRKRNCGFNTTLCERYDQTRVEHDHRVCENICPDDYAVTSHRFCLKLYATAKKARDEAEAVCQNDGGHLVNIDSYKKVQDVNDTLSEQSYSSNRLWIDGRRSVQGGPWKYGYKSPNPSFQFWGDNDPDNSVNDLCIMYNREASTEYYWRKFDYPCTSSYGFVCEIVV